MLYNVYKPINFMVMGGYIVNFSFNYYCKLIEDGKHGAAEEYKKNKLPNKIFKYVYLYDDNTEENKKRFNTLKENKLWLATYEKFNDPFEFKTLYLDIEKLQKLGYSNKEIESLNEILNRMRNSFLLTCFSENLTNNMPLWAHYANSHKGFCVEYNVKDYKYLYPVSYEVERIAIASIMINFLDKLKRYSKRKIDKHDKDLGLCASIFKQMGIMKNISWKYENEIRLLYIKLSDINSHGKSIAVSKLGLETNKIYIGAKCLEENKNELINISSKLNCDIDEMYLDDYSSTYELKYKKPEI